MREEDLIVEEYRPGAQATHVNIPAIAVRVTHTPTGLIAHCDEFRTRFKNKLEALRRLDALVRANQAESVAA